MNYYVLQVTSTGESRAKCLLYKLFFLLLKQSSFQEIQLLFNRNLVIVPIQMQLRKCFHNG